MVSEFDHIIIIVGALTSLNYNVITKDTVVDGSVNFDHMGFLNVHLNLSTR